MATQPFQVDLTGLVELLSAHLYSGPKVFLRELLQNGVDAVNARRGIEADHAGTVRFVVLPPDETGRPGLSVTDDGIGLTHDEAMSLLATIGASSKRGADIDVTRQSFIGQFGIGMLSCFLVTDRIGVETVSARADGDGLVRWTGSSDGTFAIDTAPRPDGRPLGTTVTLRARRGSEEWFDETLVRNLVTDYGTLLPVRVTVEGPSGSVRSVNLGELPWRWRHDDEDRRAAWENYAADVLGIGALDAFPIAAPAGGVEGLAFIRSDLVHSSTRPAHRVYVKRMLLSPAVDDLLPDWAFFVSCVVDATDLRPTASREELRNDATLAAVREQLGMAVRGRLVELSISAPDRLRLIVGRHQQAIKQLATTDDEFLAIVADWLPFETTEGRISLGEFRARHPTVRYTTSVDTFRQVSQVASAQGIGVVNGGFVHDAEILARVAMLAPDAAVEAVEAADLVGSLERVADERFTRLLAVARRVLAEFGCEVDVRSFAPDVLPTLYTSGDDARYQRTIDQTTEVAAPLFGSILDALRPPEPELPVLCFNAANPLVGRLARIDDDDAIATVVEVLYVQSLLLGRHPLRAAETAVLNTSLLRLVDRAVGGDADDFGAPT